MFVNNYKINLSTIQSGSTFLNVDIPVSLESQNIGQDEVVNRDFVDIAVENAINTISDYDKVRYIPLDLTNKQINNIIYNINLSGATNYGDIGFTDEDIKFEKQNFKNTFVNLSFYDTNNPYTQRLISFITIFSSLKPNDLLPDLATQVLQYGAVIGLPGQPKPANQVNLDFTLNSPIYNHRGFAEGYHLYDYRNEINIGEFKYLYMRASFKNAKTGKSTNLMVKSSPQAIDNLINEVYTRYKLFRTSTGYYYQIDDTYNGNNVIGPNNVSYLTNNVTINLYQIQAL